MIMTNQALTLAYTKSPKTSKRTTFQDELQAAVSARARKVIMDDFNDDDDDDDDDEDVFLNKLLKSRKKKVAAFKASKAKTVNFDFLDDEDKPAKSKRVSFLKTQRMSSPLEGSPTDVQTKNEHSVYSTDSSSDHSSLSSKHSTNLSNQSSDKKGESHSQDREEITNGSLSQVSKDALQDMPPPLTSDVREEAPDSMPRGLSRTPSHLKQSAEKKVPTPKPRQKNLQVTNDPQYKQFEFQDPSMQPGLSNEPSKQHNTSKCSPNVPEEGHAALSSRSQSLSDGLNTEDGRDHGLTFEELTISQPPATVEDSVDQADSSTVQLNSHISDNSYETPISESHTRGSQKSCSMCTKKVESKYLGSLRVLDNNISLQHSTDTQAPDTLRAAIYQEWLKKKKEKFKENMELKIKEDIVKEKKKEEQETKKEDAIASYEAWKEKKLESLKVMTKMKQENIIKEQRAREEKEEKKHTAKQVFEKWKHEHDHILKEKYIKARKYETEQKLEKQEKEEDRKRTSNSAFSQWSEKKQNILLERAIAKRKELKDIAEAERYIKEEKDKMASDMYESWLARKNLEKKRLKEAKWLQGILQDSPPPPWSPPNKTIPYGK